MMRVVLCVIFSQALLQAGEASRVKTKLASTDLVAGTAELQVCRIAEKESSEGEQSYHISFAFAVLRQKTEGSETVQCNKNTNCNFFNMQELVKSFMKPPELTGPTESVGACKCIERPFDKTSTPKTLLTFIATKSEPCDEHMCWSKYNQFVYLGTRGHGEHREADDSWRNKAENANHWDIGCEEGAAELDGLKSIRQLRNEAPEDVRRNLVNYQLEAGILTEDSEDEEEFLKEVPEEAKVDRKVCSDGCYRIGGKCFKDGTMGGLCPGGSFPIALQEEDMGGESLAAELAGVGFEVEERGGKIQRSGTNELKEAVQLMVLLERKLATMLVQAEQFQQAAGKLRSGKIEEALKSNHQGPSSQAPLPPASTRFLSQVTLLDNLATNMEALVLITHYNVNNLQAFKVALFMPNVSPKIQEAFLLDTKAALDLQSQVRRSLEGMVGNVKEAQATFDKAARDPTKFEAMDGQLTESVAQFMLQQLGVLKMELGESRVKLETLTAEINKV